MRGFSKRRMRRWTRVGVMVALLFMLFTMATPAQAEPDWKGAVADIEKIRDEALADIYDLGAGFTSFLAESPSAADAIEEHATVVGHLQSTGRDAIDTINEIMSSYPDSQVVQDTGSFAATLISAAQRVAEDYAGYQLNEYLGGLEATVPPPSTTTTTAPPATSTTTTTAPPATSTTTTTAPPATSTPPPPTTTTTVVRATTTTTTAPVTTTTTVPPARPTTTTTTTAPPATSTTTTTRPPVPGENVEGSPPDGESQIGGATPIQRDGGSVDLGEKEFSTVARAGEVASPAVRTRGPGLTASLTRVLEPILPARVTEAVVSPLFMLELLWRAISSSGRGLVAPISLLLFTLISLLWDKRRKKTGRPLAA